MQCGPGSELGQGGRRVGLGRGAGKEGCPGSESLSSCPARMQMNHEVEQHHYLGARGLGSPRPGFRVHSQTVSAVRQGSGKYVGQEQWHLAPVPFHAERKESARGRAMFASLDPGSFTASIQATGPVPPRHVDAGKPRKGLRSGPACGPAPSCPFPPQGAGLEFQCVMRNDQKESDHGAPAL